MILKRIVYFLFFWFNWLELLHGKNPYVKTEEVSISAKLLIM